MRGFLQTTGWIAVGLGLILMAIGAFSDVTVSSTGIYGDSTQIANNYMMFKSIIMELAGVGILIVGSIFVGIGLLIPLPEPVPTNGES